MIHPAGGAAEIRDVEQLEVRRWTRYGNDRSYVGTASGATFGFRDNRTGVVVVEDEAFRAAVERRLADVPLPRRPVRVEPEPEPTVAELAPAAWNDLAVHRPGDGALAEADRLAAAAPRPSFWARLLRRPRPVGEDERRWRLGAEGEQAVAAALATLGPQWRCLHAVPVGSRGSDIDHVLVGPAGVFTINSKHHPSAAVWTGGDVVRLNGFHQPYVRNSRHEALRAHRLLATALGAPVPAVTGLVVVVGARGGFTVKAQPADGRVVVLHHPEAVAWLQAQPVRLSGAEVERLHTVARRADTWVC